MPFEGCFRVDIQQDKRPDVVADARSLPVKKSSVEYVYCSHFLEHLTYDEGLQLLEAFLAVLRPGGLLFLTVPNLEWAFVNFGLGEEPSKVLFGGQHDEYDFHKSGYTPGLLREVVESLGFEVLAVYLQYYQINLVARRKA